MCAWIIPPVVGMIETTPAPVIYVDRVGGIAIQDGVASVYYISERDALFGDGKEINVELILKRPAFRIMEAFGQAATVAEYLMRGGHGDRPNGRPPGPFHSPRLVR